MWRAIWSPNIQHGRESKCSMKYEDCIIIVLEALVILTLAYSNVRLVSATCITVVNVDVVRSQYLVITGLILLNRFKTWTLEY